jgi:hypothetical protein
MEHIYVHISLMDFSQAKSGCFKKYYYIVDAIYQHSNQVYIECEPSLTWLIRRPSMVTWCPMTSNAASQTCDHLVADLRHGWLVLSTIRLQ